MCKWVVNVILIKYVVKFIDLLSFHKIFLNVFASLNTNYLYQFMVMNVNYTYIY